jgi:hypothetical protein
MTDVGSILLMSIVFLAYRSPAFRGHSDPFSRIARSGGSAE